MGKWAGFIVAHGIVGVASLLVALAVVWWVAPTTDHGTTFLLLLVFAVAFAAIELAKKVIRKASSPTEPSERDQEDSVPSPLPENQGPREG